MPLFDQTALSGGYIPPVNSGAVAEETASAPQKATLEQKQQGINTQIDASQTNRNYICWMREIEVTLTSRKNKDQFRFTTRGQNQFNMDIVGTKYLALTKDKGTLTISNLEYDTIVKIITGEYYDIEIKAGYRSNGNLPIIFKGEVSFITQKIHSKHDVDTYITFASTIVARYSQSRMNFNLNSGINIYSALDYVCKISGVGKNVRISPSLQKQFLQNVYNNYSTVSTVFDNMTATSGAYDLSCDESMGNVINCTTLADKRKIKIDPNTINITNGNPTVTSDGLQVTLMPTFNFMPGDILLMENSMIDVSIRNADSVYQSFPTNYLDQSGEYMIISIDYHFQNRGPSFEYNIKARALDIIKKIQGANEPVAIYRQDALEPETAEAQIQEVGLGTPKWKRTILHDS